MSAPLPEAPAHAPTPDTEGNRIASVRRYLQVASVKNMVDDIVREMARNLPEEQ